MFKEGPGIAKIETETLSNVEEKLLAVGEKTGNKMEIVQRMNGETQEHLLNPEIFDERELDSADLELLQELLKELANFENKPVITDEFGKDNHNRGEWEKDYLFPQSSQEMANYYNNNILRKPI